MLQRNRVDGFIDNHPGDRTTVGQLNDVVVKLRIDFSIRAQDVSKKSHGGTAFCEKGIVDLGKYGGYRPLLVEIVKMFKTGKSPVPPEETIELYAFMSAADRSKELGGAGVG